MDDMGVDMQLICPGPPQLYYTVPVEFAAPATRVLNDGIAEYVAKHTDRLWHSAACRCKTATRRRTSLSAA